MTVVVVVAVTVVGVVSVVRLKKHHFVQLLTDEQLLHEPKECEPEPKPPDSEPEPAACAAAAWSQEKHDSFCSGFTWMNWFLKVVVLMA